MGYARTSLYGEKMGAKVSTAYMLPEIIHVNNDKMEVLKALLEVGREYINGIAALDTSVVVDMWSIGALMFYLVTGSNLHRDISAVGRHRFYHITSYI